MSVVEMATQEHQQIGAKCSRIRRIPRPVKLVGLWFGWSIDRETIGPVRPCANPGSQCLSPDLLYM